ncbi:hypothetical protein FACS1894211_05880 [Clostridia bacterium]|nr:hypothetical protein FACS1894211_05880 [Clostridia bacterium]
MLIAIQSLLSAVSLLLESFGPIGAGIAMFTGVGAGIGIGIMTGKAVEAIGRQPEASGKIRAALLFGLAFAEMTALFGFLIAIIIYSA